MIVRPNAKWYVLVFATIRGTSLQRIWLRLLTVGLVAVSVSVLHHYYPKFPPKVTTSPFGLMAVALGIFLGFRNNTSYDRFWEGRKLWGGVVNTTRNLARQIMVMIEPAEDDHDSVERHDLIYQVIAYTHALRHHLRGSDARDEIKALISKDDLAALDNSSNRPMALAASLSKKIQAAWKDGRINDYQRVLLDQNLGGLIDLQGGCERIKSTPIPFVYTVLLHRIVAFYCFLLPFGIVYDVGLFTPFVVLMISYAFFGLDEIGDEIEDPFELQPSDLPLSAISRTIEINLRELLGEDDRPPFLEAVDGILY